MTKMKSDEVVVNLNMFLYIMHQFICTRYTLKKKDGVTKIMFDEVTVNLNMSFKKMSVCVIWIALSLSQ